MKNKIDRNSKKTLIIIISILVAMIIITSIIILIVRNNKKEPIETIGRIELIVNKKNNEPIEGIRFNLIDQYENNLMEVKTGKDGVIDFYSVPIGEYTLKVIDEESDIEEKVKKVTVEGGKLTTVNFKSNE